MQEIDIQVLWESRFAYPTVHKVQIQEAINHRDDSKASKTPISTQEFEPFNKARKNKKKKQYMDKKNSRNSTMSASKVNMIRSWR